MPIRPAAVFAVAAVAAAVIAPAATADLVSIGALKDNTLYEDSAGALSNGAGENLFVGRTNQGSNSIRRGLMAFDVAAHVPAGSIIESVTLTLHLSSASPGDRDVTLHRLLADWGEGTSDAPGSEGGGTDATPGDATWLNTFFATDTWASPGGDFSGTASALATVGELSGDPALDYVSWNSPGMVADVQSWLDAGDNFGWLLRGDESVGGTAKRFDTREDANAAYRPVLTVQYTVPGPAAWIVLLATLRRRRRAG